MERSYNFIMISPHFPENFTPFARRLKEKDINTLGIADVPYEHLSVQLRNALTEYYRVDNMDDYEQVYRAVAYFAHRYGRIDRIESHNEHWLELDAKLRTDFNVFGYKTSDMTAVKTKSGMKEVFRNLGLTVADGRVFTDKDDAIELAKKLDFPVIIKPDNGVGAGDTYKIKSEEELEAFFLYKNTEIEFIMEEFIPGDIVTFDGLTDRDGNIVFYSSLIYDSAVLEIVEKNNDMFYYIPREIPEDIIEMGTKIVEAYKIKERFFHFEFFRTKPKGGLMPLEVNLRPPGGTTIDMFNYANDFDVFNEYANIVKYNKFDTILERKYNCAYVSRKYSNNYIYAYSNDEIRKQLGSSLISIQTIPGIFATIMGDEGYLIRTSSMEQLFEYIKYLHEKREGEEYAF